MEAANTEQLEIHPTWLFWSGYYIGGTAEDYSVEKYYALSWNQLRDPMDLPNFDTSLAFPNVKPSIDVFRPPCRSRKQRGWYQVKTWPGSQPPLASYPRYDNLTTRRSADLILPELFDRLLQSVCLAFDDDRGRKRAMAKCGQVCRFWAAKCRESLFRTFTLRSRQDVFDFCNFKRDPACTFFSHLIRIVIPILDFSEKPWVHNITQLWNESTASALSLSIDGPLPRQWKTLRSIHQAVPQSLPPRFSSNITHLKLTNIRFRLFQDLTHLVNELPHLQELNSSKLTWDSFPAMLPRQREHKNSNGMRTWMLDGCEAQFATAALYLFMTIYRGASYPSLIDVPIVNALADALETETKTLGGTTECCVFYHELESRLHIAFKLRNLLLQLRAHPCSLEGIPPAFRLTIIAIEPEVRDPANTRLPINWGDFDIAVNNFRFLRMVILGFAEREHALSFADDVVDSSMPLLAARGALRYAVLPKNVWSWQQISRGSDIVKDSGMRNLIEAYT